MLSRFSQVAANAKEITLFFLRQYPALNTLCIEYGGERKERYQKRYRV